MVSVRTESEAQAVARGKLARHGSKRRHMKNNMC